ncbi:hypothetical protein LX99_04560 [Mucilaginibacter oryzae]|uniref:Uncharacterized protein n=1 Tax=Mucilaginibacter oryzae TaxID=468058 RepID=A0A316H1Q1_9SPHI|nr:hypothetical protein [Mucilaginibacter oryzae]PWK70852.1 hypothetical protein LX99_04560 [Mucilaginibacter oryzae]
MNEKIADMHIPQIRIDRKKTDLRGNNMYSKTPNIFKSEDYHSRAKQSKIGIFDEKYNGKTKTNYSHIKIGNWEFEYPNAIENIITEIKRSFSLLDMKDSWDDEGAVAVNIDTWIKAAIFLYNYAQYLYVNSKHQNVLIEPDIAPVNDGSIDLTWRTEKARLLINIKPKSLDRVSYYCDLYSDKDFSKGNVSSESINEGFAGWLNFFIKPNVGN